MRRLLTYTSILLIPSSSFAQTFLRGKIHKKASEEVLMSVSIQNITGKKFNISDMGGNFKVAAAKGDTVIFSSAGYRPDTTIVDSWMFAEQDGYAVYLAPNVETLATVRVGDLSNYQLDSIKRKEDYAFLDAFKPVKLAGGKRFSDGVGISFSPINYFHKSESQRRRLRHRLENDEKEYYIDSRFPRPWVARITGLKGDSLTFFMYRYRPTYPYCRKASNEDMLLYVNSSLKKYLRKTDAPH